MKTQAKLFAEQMSQVADDYTASNAIAARFSFRVVRFQKYNDRRGLRFADASKLFFGNREGTFELPADDASTA